MGLKHGGRTSHHQASKSAFPAKSRGHYWPYDPYESELFKDFFKKYYSIFFPDWPSNTPPDFDPIFRVEPTAPGLIMPLTLDDVRAALSKLPKHLVSGLRGVMLRSGGSKMHKTQSPSLRHYGAYWLGVVLLIPYPEEDMRLDARQIPPHLRHPYIRAGATLEKHGSTQFLIFTPESLRRYYLGEILARELGYHVGHQKGIRDKQLLETFSNRFVLDYGPLLHSIH